MISFPNPAGLVVGALFLGAILWLVRWLGNVPISNLPTVERGPMQETSNCIVVPLTEEKTAMSTVELACQLSLERHARILLVYVIRLPYTVDLNVPFPEAEEQAQKMLAMGELIVRQHDLVPESRVLRHRTMGQAVSELAREVSAQTIVMSTGKRRWWSFGRLDHIVASVMRNAPCRVVLVEQPHAV